MIITNIGIHSSQKNSAYTRCTWWRRRPFFDSCYL